MEIPRNDDEWPWKIVLSSDHSTNSILLPYGTTTRMAGWPQEECLVARTAGLVK